MSRGQSPTRRPWPSCRPSTAAQEQALRNHLGGFGFGVNAMESVAYLSGGEQARLVLALLAWQSPRSSCWMSPQTT